MKNIKLLMSAALALYMAGGAFAIDLTKWQYEVPISIEDSNNEYCRLSLTPEVYNVARSDLADIMLVAADGRQIPYLTASPKDLTSEQKLTPTILNSSTDPNRCSLLTLDFGKQVIKNSIEIDTAGNNFRRAIRIEGSNDNIAFFTVVERAFIFAINNRCRFNRVDLPTNDYRYLRCSVAPMAEEQTSPLIKQVSTLNTEKKLTQRIPLNMHLLESSEDQKNKCSIYIFDLEYCHLPLSEIELQTNEKSFYRFVAIQGRDAITKKVKIHSEDNRERFKEVEVSWDNLTSGVIYKYTQEEGLSRENLSFRIPDGTAGNRYLKIVIQNYDDQPIAITSACAKIIPHQILFPIEHGTVTMYVGESSATKPQYDLRYRVTDPLKVKAGSANLSGITSNPTFGQTAQKPVPWTEKHKVVLLTILIVMVLALGVVILKSLKSIKSTDCPNSRDQEQDPQTGP